MMKLCIAFILCVAVLVQGRNVKKVQKSKEVNVKRDAVAANFGLRCRGDNNGCCTDDNPCGKGDGDCDYDSHCARDLVCGNSNCKFSGGDDCCEEKTEYYSREYPLLPQARDALCLQGKWTTGDGKGGSDEYIGDYDTKAKCAEECNHRRLADKSINGCSYHRSKKYCYVEHSMSYVGGRSVYDTCYLPYLDASQLTCQGADDGCCTESSPCFLDDGDCDNDKQCHGSLVCGSDNCAWGGSDDCCMKRNVGDEELAEVAKEDDIKKNVVKKDDIKKNIVKEDDIKKMSFSKEEKM